MPKQTIKFRLQFRDFRFLQGYMTRRVFGRNRRAYRVALLSVVLCATSLALAIFVNLEPYRTAWLAAYGFPYPLSAYLLLILFLVLAILALLPAARLRLKTLRMQVSDDGPLLGDTELAIEEDGLRVDRRTLKAKYLWTAFQGVELSKNAIILPVDNGIGIIVPASAFTSDADRLEFAATLSRRIEEAKSRAG
jgi:hypothetical protein